jgi:DNA-binding MarR family transcriptional regulator
MSLEKELGLKKGLDSLEHETMLNIYYTTSLLKKEADEFFRQFGLTDVQFNVLMLIAYQSGPAEGLSQAQLSTMMLVNRANITSLIDRMEKNDLVVRTAEPGDRRCNIVKITAKGRKLFIKVEPLYEKKFRDIVTILKTNEQKDLIKMMEKIRGRLIINSGSDSSKMAAEK